MTHYQDAIEGLRARIVAQADAAGAKGWMDISVPAVVKGDGILRVPRGAFEQWCVHLCRAGHLVQPWKAVSPVGVKQGADDPFHTDWLLGAGLGPQDMRSAEANPACEELSSAAYAARSEVERRVLGHSCSVLLPGPDVEGAVLKPAGPGKVDWAAAGGYPPVLVLRDASPGWLEDVLHALDMGGAVVVERGGAMAHLITEVRSGGRGPVVRVAGALKLYPEDGVVRVSASDGSVRLVEQPRILDAGATSAWPPPEPEPPAVPWTAPPSAGGFGLQVLGGGPAPYDDLTYMMPAYRIEAREHVLHASWHWSGRSSVADAMTNPHMLVAYIRQKGSSGGRKIATVVSRMRIWKDAELGRACHDALYLAAPMEHPDSPETQAARARHKEQEHAWWLRGHRHQDDAALVASARLALQERADLAAEGPSGFDAHDDREYWDALESYRHTFRHYDIEFKARGMGQDILDLEMEMEALAAPDAADLPVPAF